MRTIGYIPPKPQPIPAPPDPLKAAENAPRETVPVDVPAETPADAEPVEAPADADDKKPAENPVKKRGKGEKQDG